MDLEYYKNYFLARKAELNPVKEAVIAEGGDEVDQVQTLIMNEMTERLTSRDRMALYSINSALLRIKEGTFGVCEECEDEIGEKRLKAVPDCKSCISCAERIELRAKKYR